MIVTGKLVSAVLLVAVALSSGTSAYLYQQQASQTSRASSLDDQVVSLNDQIASLNNQIDTLNSQITQLTSLNSQLGGNNSQLIVQIQQLQSEVSELQSQVDSLTQILNEQASRVIANQVTLYRGDFSNGYPLVSFVGLGSISYSGYLRVSWVSTNMISFSVQVYDANVTTPAASTGVYNVPVSGFNATANAWFRCFIYYTVSVNVCSGPDSGVMTYSLTYWY